MTPTLPQSVPTADLDKLCDSVRGKLQFMDYLVRAAAADVERYRAETDAGTQYFLRQLIEMHASSLTRESGDLRAVGDLCTSLQSSLGPIPAAARP